MTRFATVVSPLVVNGSPLVAVAVAVGVATFVPVAVAVARDPDVVLVVDGDAGVRRAVEGGGDLGR